MLAELKRSWMVVFVKVRMKFEKGDEVKYISHLDMMRTFERSLRRAKLPIAFTKGFNPGPSLHLVRLFLLELPAVVSLLT